MEWIDKYDKYIYTHTHVYIYMHTKTYEQP